MPKKHTEIRLEDAIVAELTGSSGGSVAGKIAARGCKINLSEK
jgi:hypothetical protein